jgi:ribose transport system ATP-binding protein
LLLMTEPLALSLAGLSKTFPGTKALDSVSLEIRAGEVHALMGQNGSGKSTLIKVLAGFHQPDPGAVGKVGVEPFPVGDSRASHTAGLRFVHQDLGLVGALDAVDNLALGFGYSTGYAGRIRWRAQEKLARNAIAELGHSFDVRTPVEQLTISDRTAVAIARALQDWEGNVSLLVLDEPTAAMPLPEIERFLSTVRRVVERGTAVLYVSHHLGEVFEIADRMTMLRDGRSFGTYAVGTTTKKQVVELMTGQAVEHIPEPRRDIPAGEPVVAIRGLSGHVLRSLDGDISQGEVVGIAGISGSGRDEVCDLIFGGRARKGEVDICGARLEPERPDVSVAQGIGLVPANRHRDGLILPFSVRENLTLPDISDFWRRLMFGTKAEVKETHRWIDRLKVKTPSSETPAESLSGGNQQKVVLGKWLRMKPKLLLLDEPTQGVDIASTAEIHRLIRAAAGDGAAVIVCSSDEEELAELCSKVLVLRSGVVHATLTGAEITTSRITQESLGADRDLNNNQFAKDLTEPVLAEGGFRP